MYTLDFITDREDKVTYREEYKTKTACPSITVTLYVHVSRIYLSDFLNTSGTYTGHPHKSLSDTYVEQRLRNAKTEMTTYTAHFSRKNIAIM